MRSWIIKEKLEKRTLIDRSLKIKNFLHKTPRSIKYSLTKVQRFFFYLDT